MNLSDFRIRRTSCTVVSTTVMAAGRRGPLRADHTIKIVAESDKVANSARTGSAAKFAPLKKGIKDVMHTPVNNFRRKRTPSPYGKMQTTPSKRPSLKKNLRRGSLSPPPRKRRPVERLTELGPADYLQDLPLFRDVDVTIRDDLQESLLSSSDSCSDSDCADTERSFTNSSARSSRTGLLSSFVASSLFDESVISTCTTDSDSASTPALYSPPRFLPYGSVDGRDLSPTSLPKHTSDTALLNLHQNGLPNLYSSMSALKNRNEIPRSSSPEPIASTPTPTISQSTPCRTVQPQIRGRSSKRIQRRPSLSEKLESLKNKAKTTMMTIERAVSSERLNRRSSSPASCSQTPSLNSVSSATNWSRSSSTKRSSSIKSRDSSRRRSKSPIRSLMSSIAGSPGRWCSSGLDKSDSVDGSPAFSKRQFTTIGKLMAIHQDGSQTVLLERASDGELPFTLEKFEQRGVIISGLVVSYPDLCYAGLVNVLDEIVEIANQSCHDLSLDKVRHLLLERRMVMVRIRPNLRRDAERQH